MTISVLKRMSLIALLTAPLAFLAGCNTVEGLGEDTEELGESIEGEAEEHD
ncbi:MULTISPECIES: entericidin A/B family lipoprotein [unclassified Guyparkeria]|uniref:entericidin A/B family lipoprotein n=1 Tax=unclassified Guyparkeria TaxID=2626246 RepID=UPI0009EBC06E|nr:MULTISPECIES: entericidin A/B family lipoprotein [unclassified Guyparkeria]